MNLKYIKLMAFVLVFTSCGKKKITNSDNKREEIKKEKKLNVNPGFFEEDINFIADKIKTIHPNPWSRISQKDFAKNLEKLRKTLKNSRSTWKFWKEIAPLIVSLHDAHTSISIPREPLMAAINQKKLFFPLSLYISEQGVFNVTKQQGIAEGVKIKSINGISLNVIINKMMKYVSHERRAYGFRLIENSFSGLFYLIYNISGEFEIEYVKDGTTKNKKILGSKGTPPGGRNLKQKKSLLFSRIFPKMSTIFLKINGFSQKDKFIKFITDIKAKIITSKIKNVIIDVRDNYGGNSTLGDMLLNTLTNRNFTQFLSVKVKVSKESKKKYPKWGLLQKAGIGTIITAFEYENMQKPMKKNSALKGLKLFLLIGPTTFSSALSFAAAFKNFSLGKIFGQETGGSANHFGDVMRFTLKKSNLSMGISHKIFVTSKKAKEGEGIKPDIFVKDNPLEFINGKDIVLRKALEYIKSNVLTKK